MKRAVIVVAMVAAGLVAGAVRAQGEVDSSSRAAAPAPEAPKPRLPMFAPSSAANAKPMPQQERDERQFLRDAAATGRFESDASRMALAKSENPAVRAFATTLIKHHSKAGNELQYMLQARGMASPMLANDKRLTLNRLGKLQGTKFDREFMAQVGARNQQEGVQTYERASLATRDPQLKAWIDRSLPALRYHLTTGEGMVPSNLRLAKTSRADGAAVSRASWPSGSSTR